MRQLQELVTVSQYFGKDKQFVIAGGGNTSFKNEKNIWVKASGTSLANLTTESLAVLDRELLNTIEQKEYSTNPVEREEQVKNDLAVANITKEKRPSVETSIHNIINFNFVVHLHPTFVNGLTCSLYAEKMIASVFGNEHLYVPYTDPGYVLFKEILSRKASYTKAFEKEPSVIWLQNHGIFAGADDVETIKNVYENIINAIKTNVNNISLIDSDVNYNIANDAVELIQQFFKEKKVEYRSSGLILKYASGAEWFVKISKPFIPDQIVYCKASYLFIDDDIKNVSDFEKEVLNFVTEFGYHPKIIMIKNVGMIAIGDTEIECQTIADVFEDAIKIAAISENFGGPNAMNDTQINFIEHWEVESYRRKVATASL